MTYFFTYSHPFFQLFIFIVCSFFICHNFCIVPVDLLSILGNKLLSWLTGSVFDKLWQAFSHWHIFVENQRFTALSANGQDFPGVPYLGISLHLPFRVIIRVKVFQPGLCPDYFLIFSRNNPSSGNAFDQRCFLNVPSFWQLIHHCCSLGIGPGVEEEPAWNSWVVCPSSSSGCSSIGIRRSLSSMFYIALVGGFLANDASQKKAPCDEGWFHCKWDNFHPQFCKPRRDTTFQCQSWTKMKSLCWVN